MTHQLKTWPQFYNRVADGSKTFEVRNNDRGFQMGDLVELHEWDPEKINATDKAPRGYTESPVLHFRIGYIYVLSSDQVIFSLLPILKPQTRTEKPKGSKNAKNR